MSEIIKKERPLEYNFVYAGFWIRLVAFIIDMIIIRSITTIINSFINPELTLFMFTINEIIYRAILLLYFTIMTYMTNGQTLGKMIMNIKVISLTSEKLTLSQVVSRETFGRYIQNKFMFLYIIVGLNPNKQSIIDILCDTAVIKKDIYDYFER